MFDITNDELPLRVRVRLRDRGWRFDQSAQEWRKADYSPHAADHQRAWEPTITGIVTEIEAEEQREAGAAQSQVDAEKARLASQMNATPGDTGVLGNASPATFDAGAKEETTGAGAEYISD